MGFGSCWWEDDSEITEKQIGQIETKTAMEVAALRPMLSDITVLHSANW